MKNLISQNHKFLYSKALIKKELLVLHDFV